MLLLPARLKHGDLWPIKALYIDCCKSDKSYHRLETLNHLDCYNRLETLNHLDCFCMVNITLHLSFAEVAQCDKRPKGHLHINLYGTCSFSGYHISA